MTSEVCPKCGKSFKRLKSHLPHCKGVKSSKTTSPQLKENTVSASSSPAPEPNYSSQSAKREGFTQKISLNTKNEKVAKLSSTPTVTKKAKQKLSEKIKMAVEMSSPASDASSLPFKTEKIEKKVSISGQKKRKEIENNLENIYLFPKTKSTELSKSYLSQNDDEMSGIIDANLEQVGVNRSARKQAKSSRERNILQNPIQKSTSKKKEIDIQRNGPNKAKDITINGVKAGANDNFWSGKEENEINLQENDMSTSRQEPKIMIHNVRTALGRSKQNGRQQNSNSVVKLPTDKLKCDIVNSNDNQSKSLTLQPEVPSQVMTLSPGKSQIAPIRENSFMRDLLKVENKDCNFTQRADMLKDGLLMDCHTMGRVALTSPRNTFKEAEVSNKALKKDVMPLIKPNEQKAERDMESRRDLGTQDGRTLRGALSQQRLGQVTLRELPDWLVLHSPRRPRDALEMVQRGWQWYYRKYINVKKGGVGGIAMLLTGYCLLSYVWVYPRLKRDRWRKYH